MSTARKDGARLEFRSPVEFVLVGSGGVGRKVLARSRNAGIDLIAHAQIQAGGKSLRYREHGLISGLMLASARPHVIRSKAVYFLNNMEHDNRPAECAFIWRGCASEDGIKEISSMFEVMVDDVMKSIDSGSYERVEWTLSPLIYMCKNVSDDFRRRRFFVRSITAVLLLMYGLIVSWLLMNYSSL